MNNLEQKELSALEIAAVDVDLAKNVFQVHTIDAGGKVPVRRA